MTAAAFPMTVVSSWTDASPSLILLVASPWRAAPPSSSSECSTLALDVVDFLPLTTRFLRALVVVDRGAVSVLVVVPTRFDEVEAVKPYVV